MPYSKQWPNGYGTKAIYTVLKTEVLDLLSPETYPSERIYDLTGECLIRAFGGPGAKITKMSRVDISQMGVGGNGDVHVQRALAYLINVYAFFFGRADSLVPKFGYKVDPSLNYNQMIDLIFDARISNLGIPPPTTPQITIPAIKGLVTTFLQRLRQLEETRFACVDAFIAYTQHKLYDVRNALISPGAMDQWDKSFILHMLSGEYGPNHDFGPAQNKDPNVDRIIGELKAVTDGGPKDKFLGRLATGNQEALTFYYGPYAPTLKITAGAINQQGWTNAMSLDVIDTQPWTPEDQIAGVYEAYPRFRGEIQVTPDHRTIVQITSGVKSPDVTSIQPFNETVVDQGGDPIVWIGDSPNITYVWTEEDGGWKPTYFSATRQRVMEGLSGPLEMLVEANLCANISGIVSATPVTGNLSMDGVEWGDVDELMEGGRIIRLTTKFTVYYMDRGNYLKKEVSLGHAMSPKGDWFVKPAFAEYIRPTLRTLTLPNEKYEAWILQKLQISVPDQEASRLAVRLSFNFFRVTRLLGATFTTGFNLEQYIGMLLMGRPNVTANMSKF